LSGKTSEPKKDREAMQSLYKVLLALLIVAGASAWSPSAPMMMARKSSKAAAPEPEPKKPGFSFNLPKLGKKAAPAPAPAKAPAKATRGRAPPARERGIVAGRPGAPGSAEERNAFNKPMSAFTGRTPVMRKEAPKTLKLSKRGTSEQKAPVKIAPRSGGTGGFLKSSKRGATARREAARESQANKKYVNKMYAQYYASQGIKPPGQDDEE